MFGTFYLMTYKKEYKLPHVNLATTRAGESPHSLLLKIMYPKWYFYVEKLYWRACGTPVYTAAS